MKLWSSFSPIAVAVAAAVAVVAIVVTELFSTFTPLTGNANERSVVLLTPLSVMYGVVLLFFHLLFCSTIFLDSNPSYKVDSMSYPPKG